MKTHISLKVGGDFACFTRPGFPVERVSYPVMTPSAARGLLEAIFWKPEFRWEIREIWVLKPIREMTIVRNERCTRSSDRVIPPAKAGASLGHDHSLLLASTAFLGHGPNTKKSLK